MDTTPVNSMPEQPARDATENRLVYVLPAESLATDQSIEFSVLDLWAALWQQKLLLTLIFLGVLIPAGIYALTADSWYRAEVLLAPADPPSTQGIMQSPFGGLASLAGIGNTSPSIEPIAVLRSREFARSFIEDYQLIYLFFADEWNTAAGQWIGAKPEDHPDIRDAEKYFLENIRTVSEDPMTGLVTLSIVWTDPELAAEWANTAVRRLNDRMRDRALQDAERNIGFLKAELASTSVITLQQSISRLLEAEFQKVMMARGNKEYSFKVIDPATPPKDRYAPKLLMILVAATFIAGIIGALTVFFRNTLRRHRERRATGTGDSS